MDTEHPLEQREIDNVELNWTESQLQIRLVLFSTADIHII